ncbi:hypothetical protein psal_cds_1205 [Pandoravirus salinus]|uniref:Uncharacterized protein n=1 Tax=Pandoravirus salinus TaxID=1349410 RepID=S4VXX4_9VIRU|nr:hypothetical protein psal_cds_1205 [Pandoravirus salinus]AGO85504.1 hypothetical protein psal_cds_1205 [Pandoravirus salinus]
MDLQAKELFLCTCRLLSDRAPDVTFFELVSFAEYVCTQPVRPLFDQGRKVHAAFKEACDSPSGLRLSELAREPLVASDSIDDVTHFYRVLCTRGHRRSALSSAPFSELSGSAEAAFSSAPSATTAGPAEWDRLCEDVMGQTLRTALDRIDSEKITMYTTKEEEDARRDPLALGEIFEVLGHHARSLAARADFVDLVKTYVAQFQGSARAPPDPFSVETTSNPGPVGSVDI